MPVDYVTREARSAEERTRKEHAEARTRLEESAWKAKAHTREEARKARDRRFAQYEEPLGEIREEVSLEHKRAYLPGRRAELAPLRTERERFIKERAASIGEVEMWEREELARIEEGEEEGVREIEKSLKGSLRGIEEWEKRELARALEVTEVPVMISGVPSRAPTPAPVSLSAREQFEKDRTAGTIPGDAIFIRSTTEGYEYTTKTERGEYIAEVKKAVEYWKGMVKVGPTGEWVSKEWYGGLSREDKAVVQHGGTIGLKSYYEQVGEDVDRWYVTSRATGELLPKAEFKALSSEYQAAFHDGGSKALGRQIERDVQAEERRVEQLEAKLEPHIRTVREDPLGVVSMTPMREEAPDIGRALDKGDITEPELKELGYTTKDIEAARRAYEYTKMGWGKHVPIFGDIATWKFQSPLEKAVSVGMIGAMAAPIAIPLAVGGVKWAGSALAPASRFTRFTSRVGTTPFSATPGLRRAPVPAPRRVQVGIAEPIPDIFRKVVWPTREFPRPGVATPARLPTRPAPGIRRTRRGLPDRPAPWVRRRGVGTPAEELARRKAARRAPSVAPPRPKAPTPAPVSVVPTAAVEWVPTRLGRFMPAGAKPIYIPDLPMPAAIVSPWTRAIPARLDRPIEAVSPGAITRPAVIPATRVRPRVITKAAPFTRATPATRIQPIVTTGTATKAQPFTQATSAAGIRPLTSVEPMPATSPLAMPAPATKAITLTKTITPTRTPTGIGEGAIPGPAVGRPGPKPGRRVFVPPMIPFPTGGRRETPRVFEGLPLVATRQQGFVERAYYTDSRDVKARSTYKPEESGDPHDVLDTFGDVRGIRIAEDLGHQDVFMDLDRRSVRFESGGIRTDVGKRHPSKTKGMSVSRRRQLVRV